MISVGKTYMTKAGNKVKVLADNATGKFRFIAEADDGSLLRLSWCGKAEHDGANDVVSEVRELRRFKTEIYCLSKLPIGTVSTLITHGHWYGHPGQPDKAKDYTRFRVTFEEIEE